MEVMKYCNSKEVCFLLKCAFLQNASLILLSGIDFRIYAPCFLISMPLPAPSTCPCQPVLVRKEDFIPYSFFLLEKGKL